MTLRPWAPLAGLVVLACAALACASSAPREGAALETVQHVDRAAPASSNAQLAGARCKGPEPGCRCRVAGDDAEVDPPAEGMKRFELRLAAAGGEAVLESPVLGRFAASGDTERCFYIDVVPGSTNTFVFTARALRPESGMAPTFSMTEYGAAGPWWYHVIAVDCVGAQGRCDRAGADRWAARNLQQRKRGRLDPCGSSVVHGLKWDTTGGQHERDGGLYRDFTVRFDLEVKKFTTRFAPGSTECVPK